MEKKLSFKEIFFIGLMIFSLFFGAGNLIFPAELGAKAGESVFSAMGGFLITGIGLPTIGLLSLAFVSKKGQPEDIAIKVHPIFALLLTCVTYLAIGPLFAAPRTGLVSFEIAVVPFLPSGPKALFLFLFSILFFGIVYYLALYPNHFVDRFGKLITPFLLVILGLFIVTSFLHPIAKEAKPSGNYATLPFATGLKQGYLTMDTIVSVIFATLIMNATKAMGIKSAKQTRMIILKAGLVSATCLGIIYSGIAMIGATSGMSQHVNGAVILSAISHHYFGNFGNILFGVVVLLACLPTASGVLTACSWYFNRLFPQVSYKQFLTAFTLFSAIVANIGLDQLIKVSIPVLNFIYPIMIVLILLGFLSKVIYCSQEIYVGTVLLTSLIGLNDAFKAINPQLDFLSWLALPFSNLGFSWVVPALIGGLLGFIYSKWRQRKTPVYQQAKQTINN